MDTSEIYIKMCDCPEIQEGKGYPINSSRDEICYFGNSVYADVDTCSTTWRTVWLPRQGEIQEMMGWRKHFKAPIKTRLLHSWVFEGSGRATYCQQFDSLEQLWLAFLMWEKYKKTWSGDKWE